MLKDLSFLIIELREKISFDNIIYISFDKKISYIIHSSISYDQNFIGQEFHSMGISFDENFIQKEFHLTRI